MRAAILGAGGAARAVADRARVERRARAASTRAIAQRGERGRRRSSPGSVGPWPPEPGSWDLLVNCTPIGMHPHVDDTPVAGERADGRSWSTTSSTTRRCTRLLREAAAPAARRSAASRCSVAQAHEQFQLVDRTSVPPAGVMRGGRDEAVSRSSCADENHVV